MIGRLFDCTYMYVTVFTYLQEGMGLRKSRKKKKWFRFSLSLSLSLSLFLSLPPLCKEVEVSDSLSVMPPTYVVM